LARRKAIGGAILWPKIALIYPAAARLTGFFLTRNVFEPRGLTPPPFRDTFLSALAAAIDKNEAA